MSHTTIYRRVAKNRQQGGQLYRDLPRFGKTRWKGGKRNRTAGAKLIPGRVDITKRPAVVEKRSRLGDWEGDTVHGQSAHWVTLVDRKSRFTLVKRVFSKSKQVKFVFILLSLTLAGNAEPMRIPTVGFVVFGLKNLTWAP